METATVIAIVGVGVGGIGVGVTIIVLLLGDSYAPNRNTAQVESMSAAVTEVRNETVGAVRTEVGEVRAEARQDNQQLRADMVAGFQQLAEAIDVLRGEVQQTNQMVAALANHTHDTDGRTVFTVPPPPVRQ